jgi:DNA invertase Pin-like site-specific DNA recombinase
MAVVRAKGRLRGKQPKLKPRQEAHLVELYRAGDHAVTRLEELFGVTRSTVYRAVGRAVGRGGPTTEGLDAGGGAGSTR